MNTEGIAEENKIIRWTKFNKKEKKMYGNERIYFFIFGCYLNPD